MSTSDAGSGMTAYVALLRGINVSGQKLIKMSDLKSMFAALGFSRVQTYIQSGNVLFESAEAAEPLRRRIEQEILAVFGFTVPVVLRTPAELDRILAQSPFAADAVPEGSLYVCLLGETPAQQGIDRLLAAPVEEEYRLVGQEVYIVYHQGAGKSKFTNNFIEQKLGVPATSRNWGTMNKLAEMAKALEA